MTAPRPGAPGGGGVGTVTLYNEDNRVTLARLADNSQDAVVTDPPYELDFMGKGWDRTGIAYDVALWREVCRVLKPGGHLLAFGGTRTYHRMVCAIEDAGFEIRDTLQWLYGSGFPKSLDIGKELDRLAGVGRAVEGAGPYAARRRPVRETNIAGAEYGFNEGHTLTTPATALAAQWDGWGTALKPAHEPIVLARKPLSEGTVAANVARWGTGAINVAACRIDTADEIGRNNPHGPYQSERTWQVSNTPGQDSTGQAAGRWPSNLLLSHTLWCREVGTRQVAGDRRGVTGGKAQYAYDGTGVYGEGQHRAGDRTPAYGDADGLELVSAWECAPGCPVALLDSQSGQLTSGARNGVHSLHGGKHGGVYGTHNGGDNGGQWETSEGGASRFYPVLNYTLEDYIPWLYQAKASRAERNAGCESLPDRPAAEHVDRAAGSAGMDSPRAGAGRTAGGQNHHPTVKPVALIRWLIRLITPPGGTVLDPFMGSGTGAVAAVAEGVHYIGAELDTEHGYFAIAEARRAWALAIAAGRDPLAPALWGPLFAAGVRPGGAGGGA